MKRHRETLLQPADQPPTARRVALFSALAGCAWEAWDAYPCGAAGVSRPGGRAGRRGWLAAYDRLAWADAWRARWRLVMLSCLVGGFSRRSTGWWSIASAAITAAAARHALRLARDGAASAQVSVKGGRDVVTSSDVAAEDLIRQVLAAAAPTAVIGEERGGALPAGGNAYWRVDPICGTRNYASGTSLWSVNLALIERGVVSLAVAADASTGHLHAAERGRGAWALGGAPRPGLSVSTSSQTVLIDAGKSTGQRRARAARYIAAVIEADEWDVRTIGSTLSLLYAATGRASAAVEYHAGALHTAAGALIAEEAGATVTDTDGRPWTLESASITVSADPPPAPSPAHP